jgi:hypothetical protein
MLDSTKEQADRFVRRTQYLSGPAPYALTNLASSMLGIDRGAETRRYQGTVKLRRGKKKRIGRTKRMQ